MDIEKRIAADVRSRADRDRAMGFLQAAYTTAAKGTEWESLVDEATKQSARRGADRLELYEVEGRGVGTVWPAYGMGHAWVWRANEWGYAPGLVNKSWLEGRSLSVEAFRTEFPDADLEWLTVLARGAIKLDLDARPMLDGGDIETDKDLIVATGYFLTKHLMRRQPLPFIELAPKVAVGLNVDPRRVLPYVASWYSVAHMELGEPAGTDSPWMAFRMLPVFEASLSRPADWGLEQFLVELAAAVDHWAVDRCRKIASVIKIDLSEAPPSGIFDRDDHTSQWDEFCLQVQLGPTELESAFDALVDPMIDHHVSELSKVDAVLITFWRRWAEDRFNDELSNDTDCPDDIRQGVVEALRELAHEVEQEWVTG